MSSNLQERAFSGDLFYGFEMPNLSVYYHGLSETCFVVSLPPCLLCLDQWSAALWQSGCLRLAWFRFLIF